MPRVELGSQDAAVQPPDSAVKIPGPGSLEALSNSEQAGLLLDKL